MENFNISFSCTVKHIYLYSWFIKLYYYPFWTNCFSHARVLSTYYLVLHFSFWNLWMDNTFAWFKIHSGVQVHNFSWARWSDDVSRQSTGPETRRKKTGAFRETRDKSSGLPRKDVDGQQEGVLCLSLANQLGLLENWWRSKVRRQVGEGPGNGKYWEVCQLRTQKILVHFWEKAPLWPRNEGGKQ